jgi:hypothetical protein
MHRADHVALIADQADIHGIAGNALSRACHHRQIGQAFLVFIMRPEPGQDEIGEQAVAAEDEQRKRHGAAESAVSSW